MSNKRSSEWPDQIETVYREQGRELWALFYAQCCNAERASDALQESFVRLHEQRNGTPIRDMRAWLLQVGRNWLRDVARRHKVLLDILTEVDLGYDFTALGSTDGIIDGIVWIVLRSSYGTTAQELRSTSVMGVGGLSGLTGEFTLEDDELTLRSNNGRWGALN